MLVLTFLSVFCWATSIKSDRVENNISAPCVLWLTNERCNHNCSNTDQIETVVDENCNKFEVVKCWRNHFTYMKKTCCERFDANHDICYEAVVNIENCSLQFCFNSGCSSVNNTFICRDEWMIDNCNILDSNGMQYKKNCSCQPSENAQNVSILSIFENEIVKISSICLAILFIILVLVLIIKCCCIRNNKRSKRHITNRDKKNDIADSASVEHQYGINHQEYAQFNIYEELLSLHQNDATSDFRYSIPKRSSFHPN